VTAAHLPLYIDLGLTLLKIGEEAIVPLRTFSLEGGARKRLRRTRMEVAERAGATIEIVDAAQVPALLPSLRSVSDAWLASKATREKGFSLGYFDERYLCNFPIAIVRVHNEIVAFANLWLGASGTDASLDLMRYTPNAPRSVIEYLFIELLLWAKEQGYERFSLGMAPLAGLETRALAPLWSRAGAFVYRHGEHFYNFQGLRLYKEKFDPVWEARYLASPRGLVLPRVLANVASLISGGITGVVSK
jgi:phosphatidylglycerol lysyltransferase